MNILETMLSAGGGGAVKQLATQFGITAPQATTAATALLPALAGGLQERLASGDAGGITDLLKSGTLTKFANNPSTLATPGALQQGNALLGTIFGSGDLSNLTSMVAEKAGIGSGVVGNMLPIATTLFASFLSKSTAAGNDLSTVVGQFADAGHIGILSTVKGLVSKVFG